MSNVVQAILGLILIGFSFVMFLYALPTIDDITTTGPATRWENSSATIVNGIGFINQFMILMPALIFFAGIGMAFISIVG